MLMLLASEISEDLEWKTDEDLGAPELPIQA